MARSSSNLRVVVGDLKKDISGIIGRLSANIVAELREEPPGGTPVVTGWARANWLTGVGSPPPSAEADGDVSSADGEANAGVAFIAAHYKLSMGPVFIANGVPYIVKLNDGSSQQSPAGFVQAAIMRAAEYTR